MSKILTPDQRLRVFISSTIGELAEERLAVRKVIEQLNMTPVYFESGARPHPPKDLYRAYLEQSNIFVGIYWQSYGWIAPDMEISGLEDEWRLSGKIPKLIYIKKSELREERLKKLIDDIRYSDAASYQSFINADELHEILLKDLALLLTERFQDFSKNNLSELPATSLPHIRKEIIGRTKEIKELKDAILSSNTGLITITGPGGTGKTRLAIELGHKLKADFPDGIFFVNLAALNDSARVPIAIAQALQIKSGESRETIDLLIAFLYDKNLLIILDNFEQLTGASQYISELMMRCAKVKFLITSRTPLYLREEKVFQLEPLSVSADADDATVPASVKLFMNRANEVNNSINWDDANIAAAYAICNKLDGMPLSIELTATRCRMLSPQALNLKLEKILDVAGTGTHDYPERQQTLRNTIIWSYNLLQPADQLLFKRLAIFENTFKAGSIETICWNPFEEKSPMEESLQRLIDFGLVQIQNLDNTTRYKFLRVIKEYAMELMSQSAEEEVLKKSFCNYFTHYASEISLSIWSKPADKEHLKFREEYDNLAGALNFAIEMNSLHSIWTIIAALNGLYLATGDLGMLFEWMDKENINSNPESLKKYTECVSPPEICIGLLASGFTRSVTGKLADSKNDLLNAIAYSKTNSLPHVHAIALLFLGLTEFTLGNLAESKAALINSIELQEKFEPVAGKLAALVSYANILVEEGKLEEAKQILDNAYIESKKQFNPLVESFALYQIGFYYVLLKEFDLAIENFEKSGKLDLQFSLNSNASYQFTGQGIVYTFKHDFETAVQRFKQSGIRIQKSGSAIEYTCLRIGFCLFLCYTERWDDALKLFSSNQLLLETENYKVWKSFESIKQESKNMLEEHFTKQVVSNAIEHASTISRENFYRMINVKSLA